MQLLFTQGKSFSLPPFRVYYHFESGDSKLAAVDRLSIDRKLGVGVVFAVGVSTRNFKRSTDRNRMKRLIRESWRLQKNELQEKLRQEGKLLSVFFIYTGKELADFESIIKATAAVIQKLLRMQEKQS
ncbi:MAG: ribonuclease P protein component [Chitinophagaceae bacterium]|nr:ribonuclease P protein component [Chitinophagaceae bacterium]